MSRTYWSVGTRIFQPARASSTHGRADNRRSTETHAARLDNALQPPLKSRRASTRGYTRITVQIKDMVARPQ
jgi:hypothetical protein